jgi:hypothetical protein
VVSGGAGELLSNSVLVEAGLARRTIASLLIRIVMTMLLRFLRSLDTPKLAGGEEADLSVKSAQGDVLIPTGMVHAMTELQKATLGTQKTSETGTKDDGFLAVNKPPRHGRHPKSVTVKY